MGRRIIKEDGIITVLDDAIEQVPVRHPRPYSRKPKLEQDVKESSGQDDGETREETGEPS